MVSKIRVTILSTGNTPRSVTVEGDTQIRDILDKAGIDIGRDANLVVSGVNVSPFDVMGSGREIIIFPTVKGGK